ncbi:LysR family transcriptional regulator [Paludibacterium purpuratum]|uniref:DNA-binding transcriptional LysR family regulator n=1 Tax=Paludibacterium purpuratum TaxID=1144873 RepID=A0A4R7BDF5_9NEIS|nr:LysR family transcriptional regulator [Paludibacterium purpuratum]TDR82763.1 DNA-binding transcriptional LysR family regulator [Paludibacterium purpuratum]
MIDELRALAVFAKTVEAGSFRAAAAALALSPSVVSHHVAQLEQRLGVALLYRSTRRLSLTDDGRLLYGHAREMLAAAETGLGALAERTGELSGALSVTLPAFLAQSALIGTIAGFLRQHGKVRLTLDFSDEKQDLVGEGIDLAIRIGDLQDSGLKSVRLFDLPRKLVAAPALLAGQVPLERPEALRAFDWIGISMRPGAKTLRHRDGRESQIDIAPRVRVNSIEASCQLALAGAGLCTPPAFMVADDLAAGRLVEPLPEWHVPALGVYAVWPPNAARDGLTRRLIDCLRDTAL